MQLTEKDKNRFWKNVEKGKTESDCWAWKASTVDGGYGRIRIGSKTLRAHRVSWFLHSGQIEDALFVCHKCDNRNCVNPLHLWVGTHNENMNDMKTKKRAFRPTGWLHPLRKNPSLAARGDKSGMRKHPESRMFGEKNKMSKLTTEQVIEIRSIKNETKQSIAKRFNIHADHVGRIINKKSWRHV